MFRIGTETPSMFIDVSRDGVGLALAERELAGGGPGGGGGKGIPACQLLARIPSLVPFDDAPAEADLLAAGGWYKGSVGGI